MVSSAERAEAAWVKMMLEWPSWALIVSGVDEGGIGPLTTIKARSRMLAGKAGMANRYGSITMRGRSARVKFVKASGEGESSKTSAVVFASHGDGRCSSSGPRRTSAAALVVSRQYYDNSP